MENFYITLSRLVDALKPKFIQLNSKHSEDIIYFNVNKIVTFAVGDDKTITKIVTEECADPDSVWVVKETPEEIMRLIKET